VREWTGGEAAALRKALRTTETRFARSLGVSLRTVSNWAALSG
jgi:DNA-binding transcriptional regulator YiaG